MSTNRNMKNRTYALARKSRQCQLHWLRLSHMMIYMSEKPVFPDPSRGFQRSANDEVAALGIRIYMSAVLLEDSEDLKRQTKMFNLCVDVESRRLSVREIFDRCFGAL